MVISKSLLSLSGILGEYHSMQFLANKNSTIKRTSRTSITCTGILVFNIKPSIFYIQGYALEVKNKIFSKSITYF